jgi:hypothetical protein
MKAKNCRHQGHVVIAPDPAVIVYNLGRNPRVAVVGIGINASRVTTWFLIARDE